VPVVIGTSGWQYAHWRPLFYPAGMGTSKWLAFYSQRFATVEVNNAFYRLPERATFEKWASSVPDDFVVAVKASRYLTHVRRLHDPAEPVSRLLSRATGLGAHLGPFLLQLPPTLQVDLAGLESTLVAFSEHKHVRVAVEPRHPTWFTEDVRTLLEAHGAALCLADGGSADVPFWRTTDWAYVRFHHGRSQPDSCYTRRALHRWAGRLAGAWGPSADVYCYFNNDPHGCALRDARWLAGAFDRLGWSTTRVPRAAETKVS
jgi:uncharacterized protein YecE (DUF72 family)